MKKKHLVSGLAILGVSAAAAAVVAAKKLAKEMGRDQILVVTISGRGDKDVAAIARYKGVEIYE